jgi:hypothetical protein
MRTRRRWRWITRNPGSPIALIWNMPNKPNINTPEYPYYNQAQGETVGVCAMELAKLGFQIKSGECKKITITLEEV